MQPPVPPDAVVDPVVAGPVAVVEGSAAGTWPEPGCRCVACRAATAPRMPAALRIGGLRLVGGSLTRAGVTTTLRPGERLEVDGVRVVALPGPDAPGAPQRWSPGRPPGPSSGRRVRGPSRTPPSTR